MKVFKTHYFENGLKVLSSLVASSREEAKVFIRRRGVGETLEGGDLGEFNGEVMPFDAANVLSQARFLLRLSRNVNEDAAVAVANDESFQILTQMHSMFMLYETDTTEAGHRVRDGAWSGMHHALCILRFGIPGIVGELSRSPCPHPIDDVQYDEDDFN